MSANSDVLIVGAGPAGLTAGLYASRAGLRVRCLEKMTAGGTAALTAKVENYPGFDEPISGFDLGQRMEKQARRFGLDIVSGSVDELAVKSNGFDVKTSGGVFAAEAVIVASGTRPVELGVPGEKEFRGRGVSYCATCDGPLFKNSKVAVVGGGDSALEEAAFLTRFCSRVYLIHRRDQFRAVKVLVERARANEKVTLVTHSVVQKIVGTEQGLEGVEVKDLESGSVKTLPVSGVFLYVGISPNTEFLSADTDTDEHGYVITDEEMRTSTKGLFAAGDVRKKSLRQISTAVGDGAVAAMSVVRFLEERESR
ncbi:MAG: thioredoxin reductase [Latescibacteria bacterium DG_63]|nr:MAG: thioredoxin reductase [Latescibacteria bacterium DG_63]